MSLYLTLIGANCDAFGHPNNCQEPAPGAVQATSACPFTVNGTEVATEATADMHLNSHAHDYDSENGCHQNQSHDLDPDTGKLSDSVTVNGRPVYLTDTAVANDPGSGGDIDIVDAGGNAFVTESP
mgnify:CR=1 FL=1